MRLFYLHTDTPTFPHRATLRAAGMKWDSDRKLWYSQDNASAAFGLANGHDLPGWVEEVEADVLPKGFKPRGRAFRRGNDSRRASANAASNGNAANAAIAQDDTEAESEAESESEAEVESVNGDAGAQLAALVKAIAGSAVDAATVKRIVKGEVGGLLESVQAMLDAQPGRSITVKLEALEAVSVRKLDGASHKALADVLARVGAGFRNIFLTGPSGSGKTTLARQVADALQLPFASVSCSAGMSEGVLLGRLLPTGEAGRFEYSQAPFVSLYENGGVFLLDEVDAADPNTLLVLNSATSNGHLDVPNRLANPAAKRHSSFILIVAGNTWGTGATREYVGRNQLDAAFLSRFSGASFEMDYDTDLEAALARAHAPTPEQGAAWLSKAHSVRAKLRSVGMRRIFGTRELVAGCKLLALGSVDFALAEVTRGWTRDELQKVGA